MCSPYLRLTIDFDEVILELDSHLVHQPCRIIYEFRIATWVLDQVKGGHKHLKRYILKKNVVKTLELNRF